MKHEQYLISGMHCSACAAAVERVTLKLAGVKKCEVSLLTTSMDIVYDEQLVTPDQIIAKIKKAGFEAQLAETSSDLYKNKPHKKQLLAVISGLAACLPLVYCSYSGRWSYFQGGLALLVIIIHFERYLSGFKSLFHFNPNMDALVTLSSATAFIYSLYSLLADNGQPLFFEAAAMVLAIVALGKYLEERALRQTQGAINGLMKLAPEMAVLVKGNTQLTVKTSTLKAGDMVLVKPGNRIPADGIITKGHSSINEAFISGESLPRNVESGDQVIGGSINIQGLLYVQLTKTGSDTLLAGIIRFVQNAQNQKATIARLADKFVRIFVPLVILLAIAAACYWYFTTDNLTLALQIFATVLVIACPCAMGLATPAAISTAVGNGARRGILIRNGAVLEQLSTISTVVFDKTGTITDGRPAVTAINSALTENDFLALAASCETAAEHPLAQAIVAEAKKRNLKLQKVQNAENLPGLGIKVTLENGERLLAGSKKFLAANHIDVPTDQNERSKVYFARHNQYLGDIELSDQLRSTSAEAVSLLKKLGKKVQLLSGDQMPAVRKIATEAGIDQILAEVQPTDKALKIQELQAAGEKVLMVGDGINDTPALTIADCGCAMSSGSDLAIETADLVLINNDPRQVAQAITLSAKTIKIIRENLFWASFYNILGIPLAAGLLYPICGFLLPPMYGAAAMCLSSLCVVGNALRLKRLT